MANQTLHRLREGLKAKRFTLTAAANASGIPISRLSEMAADDWGNRVLQTIERLESLDCALDQLEGQA